LIQLVDKPLAYVHWAFPWGEGELAGESGPDTWQRDVLLDLEQQLRVTESSVRLAVSSGNGIGKGALTAWVVQWFLATRPQCKGIVTANTADQLSTKTWAEVAKWVKLSRVGHWMHWQDTKLSSIFAPETWFISALPWSKDRPEAMAGLHAPYVLVILDEASAIPDTIWDTLEGAMTTHRAVWLAFGNPTRNSGRFKDVFPGGLYAHEWRTRRIDSRTAKKANRAQHEQWIATRGLDSDFVKIHVLGEHPRQSEEQFIGQDIIDAARQRDQAPFLHMPMILGADVATTNRSVLLVRQGAKILWRGEYWGKTPGECAALITSTMDHYEPDATFVDAAGLGAGIYDMIRHTNHYVIAANGAHAVPETLSLPNMPSDKDIYYNMRACMWGRMKDWLRDVGTLPLEYTDLSRELQEPQWTYAGANKILLESKEDMRSRGVSSPDCFIAGTLVDTPGGLCPIESLQVGDMVDTPMGPRAILRVWVTATTSLTTAHFSNGSFLTGKGAHHVFTWDCGWKRLDALLLVNRIETNNTWRRMLWKFLARSYTPVKPFGFKHQVDTISQGDIMRRRDFYIGASTQTIMGLFLRGMWSIMTTRIGKTTHRAILSLNWMKSMGVSICSNVWRTLTTGREPWRGWARPSMPHVPGIVRQKGWHGIASMAKPAGMVGSLWQQCVRSAERALTPTSLPVLGSALGHACSVKATSVPRRVMASVKSAVCLLWSISTGVRPVVPVNVEVSSGGMAVPVYNLTLDGDNVYYANGVLVANCADSLSLTFYATVRPKRGVGLNGHQQQYATPAASPFAPRGGPRQQFAGGGSRR
jgi:hypothetical protein